MFCKLNTWSCHVISLQIVSESIAYLSTTNRARLTALKSDEVFLTHTERRQNYLKCPCDTLPSKYTRCFVHNFTATFFLFFQSNNESHEIIALNGLICCSLSCGAYQTNAICCHRILAYSDWLSHIEFTHCDVLSHSHAATSVYQMQCN